MKNTITLGLTIGVFAIIAMVASSFLVIYAAATSQGNESAGSNGTLQITITDANDTTVLDEELPIVLCPDPADTSIMCSGIDGTPGGTDEE